MLPGEPDERMLRGVEYGEEVLDADIGDVASDDMLVTALLVDEDDVVVLVLVLVVVVAVPSGAGVKSFVAKRLRNSLRRPPMSMPISPANVTSQRPRHFASENPRSAEYASSTRCSRRITSRDTVDCDDEVLLCSRS